MDPKFTYDKDALQKQRAQGKNCAVEVVNTMTPQQEERLIMKKQGLAFEGETTAQLKVVNGSLQRVDNRSLSKEDKMNRAGAHLGMKINQEYLDAMDRQAARKKAEKEAFAKRLKNAANNRKPSSLQFNFGMYGEWK